MSRNVGRVATGNIEVFGQAARTLGILGIAGALAIPPLGVRAQEEPGGRPGPEPSAVPSLESDTPRFDDPQGERGDETQILTRALRLADRGFAVDGTWIIDETGMLYGGRRPGYWREQNLLDLAILSDLEKAFAWEGASAFLLFQSHRGTNANSLAGDEQFFDQLDAEPYPARGQISELWFQFVLADERLRLKLGKMDSNEDFAYVANGNDFLHGAFGNAPTIFLMPTYPDPATGIAAFFTPNENVYGGAGIYDGSFANGTPTGRLGPEGFFQSPAGYFLIAEGGFKYLLGENQLPGRIGGGYWHSTARFLVFEGFEEEVVRRRRPGREEGNSTIVPIELFQPRRGTGGPYAVLDQMLWMEEPPRAGATIADRSSDDVQGIGIFYQFGAADPDVNIFETYHGGGIFWRGFQRGRDDDAIGFGIAASKFSDEPLTQNFRRRRFRPNLSPATETAFQAFYRVRIHQHVVVQPNLTWVHDPGQNKSFLDAVALTLRLLIDF